MSETVIRGTVSDVIGREEVGRHIVPDATRYHIHDGEELAMFVPDDRGEHPLDVLDAIPLGGLILRELVAAIAPRRWLPPANYVVIAPAGTFDAADDGTHEIVVEPVVDSDVPAADGDVPVYRYVESVPFDEREGVDWPTPSWDRPGACYHCYRCGDVVVPSDGDKEAGLVRAGATTKLCGECAEAIEDAIARGEPLPPHAEGGAGE